MNAPARLADILVVQRLLTTAAKRTANGLFDPKGIDGAIARAPKTSGTLDALFCFQKQFLPTPDRRVDPGGRTWNELLKYDEGELTSAVGPPQLVTYNGKTGM